MFSIITELTRSPVGQAIEGVKDGLGLFLQEPAVYFLALAFVGASLSVARKLVPMRKR